MSGYYRYSMSNNAKDCYDLNIKPMSKWSKTDILESLEDYEINQDVLAELKKCNVKQLRKICLSCEEWHHTSSYFNKTNFYKIDSNIEDLTVEELKTQINLLNEKFLKEEEKKSNEKKARCKYLEWSGTRKHPKAIECESIGTIKGNWFYLPSGTKKSISAKGFEVIEYLQ